MDIETLVVVHFRREKTYDEFQAELGKREAEGKSINPKDFNRWFMMGEMLMAEVPQADRFIFINGVQYQVRDVTWSLHLNKLPGQPNFENPQVMITLALQTPPSGSYAPTEDFFQ